MLQKLKDFFSLKPPPELKQRLEDMIRNGPVPVFWLLGKTQSGKTSVVRFLSGAENAEIGQGFKPCTRFSRVYHFPNEQTPLLKFLDTRGLDEPGYDPAEDLERFHDEAHVLIITVRVLDQALATLLGRLEKIRAAEPNRPFILVPTCLHEAYPQQQHYKPYPFRNVRPGEEPWQKEHEAGIPEALRQALTHQLKRFEGLYDHVVPIDFTLPEEGFDDPYYGGPLLKQALVEALPGVYRQTLISVEGKTGELRDVFARHALPHIITYSGLAAAAGAVPLPWVDLFLAPAIQTRMITQLAKLYDQAAHARQFMELAAALGLGLVAHQAARSLAKVVPFLGASLGNALSWGAATFALGKACCYYFAAVRQGQIPQAEDLRQMYQEQMRAAETSWRQPATAPQT
jgi:uncharacterized protein (DUF697 family)